jgi:hypothetical protein
VQLHDFNQGEVTQSDRFPSGLPEQSLYGRPYLDLTEARGLQLTV